MHERVEMNPNIMGGKPVIRVTRVPVEAILRKLGAGMPESEILADHPHLTVADIRISLRSIRATFSGEVAGGAAW